MEYCQVMVDVCTPVMLSQLNVGDHRLFVVHMNGHIHIITEASLCQHISILFMLIPSLSVSTLWHQKMSTIDRCQLYNVSDTRHSYLRKKLQVSNW